MIDLHTSGDSHELLPAPDRCDFTISGPIVVPAATITARGAVLYRARGGVASADDLIACYDFGADISATGVDFTITPTGNAPLWAS